MIETLIAALLASLALLFIPHPVAAARSVAPAPPASSAPHSRTAPHPSAPASVSVPPAPVDPSRMITCPNGTEWQGADLGCVATQLPGETSGRAQG